MRASVASLSKKFISTFFAATLALGLVPAAAFAVDDENSDDANASTNIQAEAEASAYENNDEGLDGSDDNSDRVVSTEGSDSDRSGEISFPSDGDDSIAIPAATQRINEDMALQTRTVAQAESTRSYFLAQTLESTRTVPIVSANLPLDTSTADVVVENNAISEDEGGEDPDESDLVTAPIAAESIVVGSFEYCGITYAVEPGGESVAVVAADYAKLPEGFIEAQVIVLPSMVTAGSMNYYAVTRIGDNAFGSLAAEAASTRVTSTEASESERSVEISFQGEESLGITAITIPAPVTEISDDAFTGFDTLQYIIASEDNPNYGMYDGCLYDTDLTRLLLIPEGRLGAVRIAPSVTEVDPEVFSHCPSVDTLVADADSAAYQLLSENDLFAKRNTAVASFIESDEQSKTPLLASYRSIADVHYGESYDTALLFDDHSSTDFQVATLLIDSNGNLVEDLVVISDENQGDIVRVNTIAGDIISIDVVSLGALYSRSVDSRIEESTLYLDEASQYSASSATFGTAPSVVKDTFIYMKQDFEDSILLGQYHNDTGTMPYSWDWGGYNAGEAVTAAQAPYHTLRRGVWTRVLQKKAEGIAVGGTTTYGKAYYWGNWFGNGAETCFLGNANFNCGAKSGSTTKGRNCAMNFVYALTYDETYKTNGAPVVGGTMGTGCAYSRPLWIKAYATTPDGPFTFFDEKKEWNDQVSPTGEYYLYVSNTPPPYGYNVIWNANNSAGETFKDYITYDNEFGLGSIQGSNANTPKYEFVSPSDNNLPKPVRDGYSFDGWYTNSSCAPGTELTKDYFTKKIRSSYGENDTEANTILVNDQRIIQFYAKWKATAVWNANGGTMSESPSGDSVLAESTSYDSSANAENRAGFVAPLAPTAPAGWEFAGWANTADPRDGEDLVQPGDTVYNHLLTDDAKAGNPTFYARWQADVAFDTSRGSEASGVTGTSITAMPNTKTVYAGASDGVNPLTATLPASSIASVTQKYYKFNGYKVTPVANTPGVTTWYTYATLPAGTVSASDAVGSDATGTYTDGMTFTLYGASNLTLLWAPTAYAVTFDAGKTQYATAPGTVTGMVSPWSIDTADTATVPEGQTKRAWKRTYTYDDATIALPSPQLAGYTYTLSGGALLGSAAAAARENNAFDAKQAATLADATGNGTNLKTLAFDVTWEKSPYAVQVLGNTFPVGTGNYAFAANGTPLLIVSFDGSHGIVIPELFAKSGKTDGQAYFDDDYMSTFTGWTIGTLVNGAFTPIATDDIPNNGSLRSYSIGLSQMDAFFEKHGVQPNGSSAIVVYAQPNFNKTPWSATIVVPNDATLGGLDGNWNVSGKSATRSYTCETSDFTLPGTNDVKRFGYTFSQWKVTARKGGTLVTSLPANPYSISANASGVFQLAKNTIYDLTIEPDWVATTTHVRLVLGADDARFTGTSPVTEFKIDFGQPMTAAKTTAGGAYVIPSATRTNYTFLGYFDANGRQYITAGCGSARPWDKEPADAPYELIARWQSDDLTNEGTPTEPQAKVDATSPASKVTIRSNDGVSSAKDVLVGSYNGKMQWSSTAEYPRSLDTVVVNVSSYTPNASNTAAQIRSDFGEREGHYILGFRIGSDGSYVPFYDLIYGNAFTLSLLGSDLVRSADTVAPTFAIDPSKVKIVWSDQDPGYGPGTDPEDNPPTRPIDDGDLVANVFDAGAGAFKDVEGNADRIQVVTTDIPSASGTVLTKLPEKNPVRAGYEFLGWSSVPQIGHKASGCDEFAALPAPKGQIPAITVCGTKTYYAHWAPHTYTVAVMGNYDGALDPLRVTWRYGEQTDQPTVTSITRTGFACVGFFDTPEPYGGTMYLTRDGVATRAWDKGNDADPQANVVDHRLYARWASTTGDDDPDPFPGVEGVTPLKPTTNDNHNILVSALDGKQVSRTVLSGTYEGFLRFRQPAETVTPNATAPVQVMVNYYEPTAGIDKREAELAAVQKTFEDNHPADLPYLQGFRVVSTGDYIAWSDIVAGKSIDIDCLGRDLVWGGAYAAPASFRMDAKTADNKHVLVAVYGATPSVDPDDGETVWPVPAPGTSSNPATEVRILFDAGAGRFTDGTRFLAVKTAYKGKVALPSATSDLPLPPAPDGVDNPAYKSHEGWSFAGWVDAQGNPVTNNTFVGALSGTVYYAKYTQQTWTVDFVPSDAAHKDVVLTDGTPVPAGYAFGDVTVAAESLSIEPYDNQAFNSKDFGYPTPAADTFTRAGYQFLGWFDSSDATQVTKAYYLTDKGREVMGSDLLNAQPTTITADTTMYALWTPRTYTVEWYLNYPAYTIDGKEYPKTEGTSADLYRRDTNLVYGQPVEASFFAAPANPRYQFDMWAHGRTDAATAVVAAKGSIRKQADNSYCFQPANPASDTLMFCALWNTKIKTKFAITLYAGDGGTFPGGATSFTTDRFFDDPVCTLPARGDGDFPITKNGYAFKNWVEANADGTAKTPTTVATSIPAGVTGSYAFLATWTKNDYTVSLTNTGGLRPEQYGEDMGLAWDNEWSHDFKVGTTDTWQLPTADQMNALNVAQSHKVEGMSFTGWRLSGTTALLPEPYTFDPVTYLAGFASYDDVKNAVYEAVWTPKTYTVVLDADTEDDQHNNMVYTLEYGADKTLKLPVPVLRGHAGVFSHWDISSTSSRNKAWVPGVEVSVPTILNDGQYGEANVQPEHVCGMRADGTLVDVDMDNVIRLHARYNGAHNTEMPLQVIIFVDPETGDMILPEAYLRTANTNLDAVAIEGLTYEKVTTAEGAGLGEGTENVFKEVLDRASLTVRAQKQGSDQVTNVSIPLNAPGTRTGADAAGFETFNKSNRLDITYGLDFDLTGVSGATDKDKVASLLQTMYLPNKLDLSTTEANRSRLRFPIAKLYYTVSLVRAGAPASAAVTMPAETAALMS